MGVICKKPLGGGSYFQNRQGIEAMRSIYSVVGIAKYVYYALHRIDFINSFINRLYFASNIFLMYLYHFVIKCAKIS